MNHVTRGMGKRSGMLATGGLGRRVIFILELATQYISSAGRIWSAATPSRSWLTPALERVRMGTGTARAWAGSIPGRTYTAFSTSRSWALSTMRRWSGRTDRSWSDDAD